MKITIYLNKFLRSRFYFIYFGIFGLLALAVAISSLRWIIGLDLQPVIFAAYLTDKFHMLPYKDFFYYNFPFVHFFFFALVKIFGYGYLGIRIADLLYLISILTVSYFIFKKISWKIAVSGIIIFSLIYFAGQNYFSLQRDLILILPLILSILIFISAPGKKLNLKSFLAGFLCSCAFLIKPHALIFFPIILFFHLLYNSEENSKIFSLKKIIKIILFSGLGFLVPIGITLLYFWSTDSWRSFWDILTNFMAFYRKSKAAVVTDPSMPVETSIFRYKKLGGFRPFGILAAIGFYIAIFRTNLDKKQKLIIYMLGALSIVATIYVVYTGKMMTYYWLPFAYFVAFLGSACLIEQKKFSVSYAAFFELIPVLIFYFIITFQINRPEYKNFYIYTFKSNSVGNQAPYLLYPDIVQTAEFLKKNLKPGDKVLPLDDNGNAKHAMLLAGAEIATYYIDECVLSFGEREFPDNEYLHKLHKDYMEQFNTVKPRFVIDFSGEKHFDDLQQALDSDYVMIKLDHGQIYQRKN